MKERRWVRAQSGDSKEQAQTPRPLKIPTQLLAQARDPSTKNENWKQQTEDGEQKQNKKRNMSNNIKAEQGRGSDKARTKVNMQE